MEPGNVTVPSKFIILGFNEWPNLRLILFIMFLLIYFGTLIGNLTIITLISIDGHLHTPMYFFLWNMSILDLTFISTVLPKLLYICLTKNQSITYLGCMSQMSLFVTCVVTEYCLLAVMTYDLYMAICHPLHYPYFINMKVCAQLAMTSWSLGLLVSFMFLGIVSQHSFCRSNIINHLFCDLKPLIKLSCSATWDVELAVHICGTLFGLVPLVFILMTYILIITTVLRIRSNRGKRKAFSTCSSHLTVVILFFGIIHSMYMRPKSAYSIEQDQVFAVLYTSCIPMLNPVIYSLRNKEVKNALWKLRGKIMGPTYQH